MHFHNVMFVSHLKESKVLNDTNLENLVARGTIRNLHRRRLSSGQFSFIIFWLDEAWFSLFVRTWDELGRVWSTFFPGLARVLLFCADLGWIGSGLHSF